MHTRPFARLDVIIYIQWLNIFACEIVKILLIQFIIVPEKRLQVITRKHLTDRLSLFLLLACLLFELPLQLLLLLVDPFDHLLDGFLLRLGCLDPAGVVPDHVLVKQKLHGLDLLEDHVLLDVLVHPQIDPDLFDGVHVRVKLMLHFEDSAEPPAAQLVDFLELLVVAVTLEILANQVALFEVACFPLDVAFLFVLGISEEAHETHLPLFLLVFVKRKWAQVFHNIFSIFDVK